MKHTVKDLMRQSEEVIAKANERAEVEEKRWVELNEARYRALRDRMTLRLRRGEAITETDFRETVGSPDLGYGKARAFSDPRKSPITALRSTRPRQHVSVYYDDIIAFRNALSKFDENSQVSDRDLADLGFARFPAVLHRLQNPDRYWGSQVIW
ncbi:hypothetical protein KNU78_gp08 [Gordonia phage Sukkupi]|uniref:Uncharacterized protein n=1 Tax=Gordonia phage Sukkupi TaxID=2653747 RepID=A0A5Q2WNQ3_9CAUD|nr:hypothetical protein KNU78_gp08 [Gordonia phage Sukkupi]QAU07057.1 hypothetical protein SEA_BIPAUNETO_8 [Gordonia phage BiPauneto]QGH79251.1 hypothetical protein SEA_SUKKUPI_8 [Gordonia phage Sukkupi]QGH80724.1 hypothetical protein SEA_YNDEXA_8 [Gordonia phage Yndexa]